MLIVVLLLFIPAYSVPHPHPLACPSIVYSPAAKAIMSTNDNGNDNDNNNDNEDPDGPSRTPQNQPQRWFPLESNPDLMNSYIEKLGFNTNRYHFVDVFYDRRLGAVHDSATSRGRALFVSPDNGSPTEPPR